ncbi:hypothetical protein B0H11DRAFT_2048895, partial [Mycena galericulata]
MTLILTLTSMPKGAKAKLAHLRLLNLTGGKAIFDWRASGFRHDRCTRAKCRLLCMAGVPKDALAREFGGSVRTMTGVIRNEYKHKDDTKEDLGLALQDPTFQARLDNLKANGFDNPNRYKIVQRRNLKRVKSTKKVKQEEPDSSGGLVRLSLSPRRINRSMSLCSGESDYNPVGESTSKMHCGARFCLGSRQGGAAYPRVVNSGRRLRRVRWMARSRRDDAME